jgi:hypothetical protein
MVYIEDDERFRIGTFMNPDIFMIIPRVKLIFTEGKRQCRSTHF